MSECVERLRSHFLRPEKIVPRLMTARAIEFLQGAVTSLLVRRENDDEELGPQALVVTMRDTEKTFDLMKLEGLDSMLLKISGILTFIDENLPKDTDRSHLETMATNALLHTLDPHTTYLDPASYLDMQVETSGEFGGLGIVISVHKGELTVISVMSETPADKAGMKARDQIVQIEDESTINMDLSSAVNRLRGKPGAPVMLRVLRKGWETPRSFTVTRERIEIRSVVSEVLSEKIAYVRLKNFRANTSEQLKAHLMRMTSEVGTPLRGVILDLRGNPGGFLEQAIRVSDLFLDKGEIVRTIGAGGKVRGRPRTADSDGTADSGLWEKVPLAVLISGSSASASEIVAGALRNQKRALIIGEQSFGKGTVQGIYGVGDGAVKITIAEYLTPGGVPVHEVGVTPDVVLRPQEISPKEIQVFGYLEDDEDEEAANEKAKRKGKMVASRMTIPFVLEVEDEDDESVQEEKRFRYDELERDFALKLSEAILVRAGHRNADKMFANAKGVFVDFTKQQETLLQKVLMDREVDWGAGAHVPRPRLEAEIKTIPADAIVRAGEKLKIELRLSNTGNQTLRRIHAIGSSSTRLLDGREFLLGGIEPGAQRSAFIEVAPALSAYGRNDPFEVEFYQDGKKLGLSRKIVVGVEGAPKPEFAFTYFVDDSEGGNGDGRIQRGEEVRLHLTVRNVGDGPAPETTVALKNLAGDGVFIRKGRRSNKEALPVGGEREAVFDFEVRPGHTQSEIPFNLSFRAGKTGVYLSERLLLPVHGPSGRTVQQGDWSHISKEGCTLRSGASAQFPAVAKISAGEAVKIDVVAGKWGRFHSSKSRGWLRTRCLDEVVSPSPSEAGVAPAPLVVRAPSIVLTSPKGSKLHELSGESVLKGEIVFHPIFPHQTFSSMIFVGGRKVWFDVRSKPEADLVTIPFEITVKLEPGANRVSIRAIEKDRVEVVETFFIHRAEEPAQ